MEALRLLNRASRFALTFLCLSFTLLTWLPGVAIALQTVSDGESSPADLPDWIHNTSFYDGAFEYVRIHTEPKNSQLEADSAIGPAAYKAVHQRIEQWTGAQLTPEEVANIFGVDEAYVVRSFISDDRIVLPCDDEASKEIIERSGATGLYRGHAQLQIGNDFRSTISGTWERRLTERDTKRVALLLFSGLILLAIVFAYLRLNKATRGFFSRRLQLLAIIAIIALAAICGVVFRNL